MSIHYPDNSRWISSGHFSVDTQAFDALDFLEANHPEHYKDVTDEFPEVLSGVTWTQFGTHVDTEAMGLDIEWTSWLIDAIEATGVVIWEDGEPLGFV